MSVTPNGDDDMRIRKSEAKELLRGLRLCDKYAIPDTPDMSAIQKKLEKLAKS